MGASDDNTYNIPDLVLGDTFYEWMQLTNRDIIAKLNEMTAYSVVGGDGVSADVNSNGQVQLQIAPNVLKGITFHGDVSFMGDITKINSIELSVDDYNLVLGSVEGPAGLEGGTLDVHIETGGGGGVIIKRHEGEDAHIMWHPIDDDEGLRGVSGSWYINNCLNITGGACLMSYEDKLRFKTGANATGSGFMIGIGSTPGNSGTSYQSHSMLIGHQSTGGHAHTGGIYFDEDGMVRIYDGVNKKLFTHDSVAHGFTFGDVVRIGDGGTCTKAHANSKEQAETFGIVSEVIGDVATTTQFVVTMNGEIHGDFATTLNPFDVPAGDTLTPGSVYFLSGVVGASGSVTSQEQTEAGKIRKPMILGLGATSGYVLQYVGAQIAAETDSGAPVMKRISVASDGTYQGSVGIEAVAETPAGRYTVTHNFGTTSYSAVVSWLGGAAGVVAVYTKGSNECEIRTYDASHSYEANAFELLLAKDVT